MQDVKVEKPLDQKPESAAPKGDAPIGAGDAPEGTDGFGLGHGNGGGGGGGGGGSPFAWYRSTVQKKIYEAIDRRRRLRDEVIHGQSTAITVQIWLSPDGKVQRVAIAESNAKPEIDRMLIDTITALDRIGDEQPANLPQPLLYQLGGRSRGKTFGG